MKFQLRYKAFIFSCVFLSLPASAVWVTRIENKGWGNYRVKESIPAVNLDFVETVGKDSYLVSNIRPGDNTNQKFLFNKGTPVTAAMLKQSIAEKYAIPVKNQILKYNSTTLNDTDIVRRIPQVMDLYFNTQE